jgi:hypothetical protein
LGEIRINFFEVLSIKFYKYNLVNAFAEVSAGVQECDATTDAKSVLAGYKKCIN